MVTRRKNFPPIGFLNWNEIGFEKIWRISEYTLFERTGNLGRTAEYAV
jgi:hypothetical protein